MVHLAYFGIIMLHGKGGIKTLKVDTLTLNYLEIIKDDLSAKRNY